MTDHLEEVREALSSLDSHIVGASSDLSVLRDVSNRARTLLGALNPLLDELSRLRAESVKMRKNLRAYEAITVLDGPRLMHPTGAETGQIDTVKLGDLFQELSRLRAERQWISVEDKCPDGKTKVIISDGINRGLGLWWEDGWLVKDLQTITHWLPLPSPPGAKP